MYKFKVHCLRTLYVYTMWNKEDTSTFVDKVKENALLKDIKVESYTIISL